MPVAFQYPREEGSAELVVRGCSFTVPVDWWKVVKETQAGLPTVMAFHGGDMSAEAMLAFMDPRRAYSGQSTPTEAKLKFVLICPQGLGAGGTAWNSGPLGEDVRLLGVVDGGFASSLLELVDQALVRDYREITGDDPPGGHVLIRTDNQRWEVHLTGFSNGGQFAYRMSVKMDQEGIAVRGVAGLGTSMGGWWPATNLENGYPPDFEWFPRGAPTLIVHGKLDKSYGAAWNLDGVSEDVEKAGDQLEDGMDLSAVVRADISALSCYDGLVRDYERELGAGTVITDATVTYGTLLGANGAALEGAVEWSGGPAIHFVTKELLIHTLEPWEADAVWCFFEAFGGL